MAQKLAVNVFVGTSDTISELPTKIKPIGRAPSVGGSVKLLRGVGTSGKIKSPGRGPSDGDNSELPVEVGTSDPMRGLPTYTKTASLSALVSALCLSRLCQHLKGTLASSTQLSHPS